MAYQSAKQNRRSVAGNSLLRSGRKSFTHQVFRPNQTSTQLESLDSDRLNNWTSRDSTFQLETIRGSVASQSECELQQTVELSNNSNQRGNTQFLLCKFFVSLIQTEEHLMKAKADFMELRFDLESRFMKKFSPVMLFQRIDRAAKGHLTRLDVLKFLEENGYVEGQGFTKADLKLIFR